MNILLSLLLPIAAVVADNDNWTVGRRVKTTSGFVTGHPAPNASHLSEYLGIPYAKPPVGDLRFASPRAFEGHGTVDGSNFVIAVSKRTEPQRFPRSPALQCLQLTAGNACSDCPSNTIPLSSVDLNSFPEAARNIFLAFDQVGNNQSEDCLTLNVWAKPQRGDKKAVVFWVHGGSFRVGTSHVSGSSGQYLADTEDVVVVSINYRLNIFGFPGLPGHPQNVGIQDQRLALEWVHDNIEAFGGDPERITFAGQSAGSASADIYSYAYTQDPIVRAFVMQSGTATAFGITNHDNLAAWWFTSAQLGCGAQEDVALEASLSCVRGKPFTDVLAASRLAPSSSTFLGNFPPTIDETLVFSDYDARSLAGNFIRAPVLIGNTDYEVGIIGLLAPAAYAALSPAARTAYNLVFFVCPTAKAAFRRALHGVPTWRYRWFGEYTNTHLFPGSGAWHGSEIGFVFGTTEDLTKVANEAREEAVEKYVMKAWARFAKRPKKGLGKLGWPRYNATTETLIQLGKGNETTASFALPATFDAACAAVGQNAGT
ncbi:MAG: hypothetical protein M1839_005878 [Geoglossum umbratile]|nr:MAG: hypothetical protein M1839_005878 [Geoglossum umbratile]